MSSRSALFTWLGVVILVIGIASSAMAECNGIPSQFAMLCRGPITLISQWNTAPHNAVRADIVGRFFRSPDAAGTLGSLLRPSECGWVDRPIDDTEPNQFRMRSNVGHNTPGEIHGFDMIQRILVSCAGNPNCVAVICAQNLPDEGIFHMNPTFINTLYPAFER